MFLLQIHVSPPLVRMEVCARLCTLNHVEGVCPGKFNPIHRWFFDSTSGSCKHFLYSGCKGNANNFPSRRACQEQCSHGVCCYRQYKLPRPSISSEDEYAHSRDTLGYNLLDKTVGSFPTHHKDVSSFEFGHTAASQNF
uniref:BPTI/Kunitz inhibitor domain-containing protein n=1 Tax=Astyanax mexicanus TaxID=7994 RepID=A0A8B9H9X1_ASTMX